MRKRPWIRHNVQDHAFTLLSKGKSPFYVAEALDITIREARQYQKMLQEADEVTAKQRQKIREDIEKEWAREREEVVADLCERVQQRNQGFDELKKRIHEM
ncbi:MAG: hypothetical protein KGI60_00680 [Patescibacteria group bacterium]|nr:hypothetical protein [Patescibacteria group bacterium]